MKFVLRNLRTVGKLLIVFLLMSLAVVCAAQFAGGSGTEADPWQVAAPEHLNNIRYNISEDTFSGHYLQTADICLNEYLWDENANDLINNGRGWEHLGDSHTPFRGTYDGNHFTINGLCTLWNETGLFGKIESSELRNIRLTNVLFIGGIYGGGLVSHCSSSVISNCHTEGFINSTISNIGGLAGRVHGSSVENSTSSVTIAPTQVNIGIHSLGGLIGLLSGSEVTNSGFYGKIIVINNRDVLNVGGIVGSVIDSSLLNCVNSGEITVEARTASSGIGGLVGGTFNDPNPIKITDSNNTGNIAVYGERFSMIGGVAGYLDFADVYGSYNTGNIDGYDDTGGLIGKALNCTIKRSYSTGNVKGNNNVGGLVGKTENVSIINTYANSNVSGKNYVAGLVASMKDNSIEKSYSTGKVTGDYAGGLIAENSGAYAVHSYWDTETSGQAESAIGEARQSHHLTYPYNQYTFYYWDFEDIWIADEDYSVNDGYPYLRPVNHLSVPEEQFERDISPTITKLNNNYPNPFNPETVISFSLAEAGEVLLEVFNIKGQKVATVLAERLDKGDHQVIWDGKDNNRRQVGSGVYFYRMRSGSFIEVKRMILLK